MCSAAKKFSRGPNLRVTMPPDATTNVNFDSDYCSWYKYVSIIGKSQGSTVDVICVNHTFQVLDVISHYFNVMGSCLNTFFESCDDTEESLFV